MLALGLGDGPTDRRLSLKQATGPWLAPRGRRLVRIIIKQKRLS
jgi:hypothetical protein